MPIVQLLQPAGLYTGPNALSAAPPGGLLQADNVVIRQRGVIEPRRSHLPQTAAALDAPATSIHYFGAVPIVRTSAGTLYRLATDLTSATAYTGTFTLPDPTSYVTMKAFEAGENFYFTTSNGVYWLDTSTSTPTRAGVEQATDLWAEASDEAAVTDTALATGKSVAYRVVWGIRDSSKRVILGAPGGRTIVTNTTGATINPLMQIPLPTDVTSGHFVQVFRSEAVDATVEPPDDVYQVFEYAGADTQVQAAGTMVATAPSLNVVVTKAGHTFTTKHDVAVTSSADANFPVSGSYPIIATTATTYTIGALATGLFTGSNASSITVTPTLVEERDRCPEVLLGDPLYTNPSDGEGVLSANNRPPKAQDVTYWQDRAWYANVTSKHRFDLRLIGVGAPAGVQDGDTLVVGATTYTFKTIPATYTDVQTTTSGTATQNVVATSRALVATINGQLDYLSAHPTVRAQYVSGADGFGDIVLEELNVGGSAFNVYSTRPPAFSPYLTTTATNCLTSDNDRAPNRIYFSKLQQPESVPLLRYVDVGPKNKAITRIVPLRDRLYVFKEDGTYVLSGEYPYRVDLHDNTALLVGAQTPSVVNNAIYCFTTQGVVAVSDGGVQVVSKPIETDLLPLFNVLASDGRFATAQRYSFGIGYESERQYILYLGGLLATGSYPSYAYCLNVTNGAWTRWTGVRSCAAVDPTYDRLILGNTAVNNVFAEQKASLHSDYGSEAAAVSRTITTWAPSATIPTTGTLTVSASIVGAVDIGDYVRQNSAYGRVTGTPTSTSMTLDFVAGSPTFTAGNCSIFRPVSKVVRFLEQSAGDPSLSKKFREVHYHFRDNHFYAAVGSFTSDLAREVLVPLRYPNSTYNTSTSLLPTTHPVPANFRELVPIDLQRCQYLIPGVSVSEIFGYWALNGMTLIWETGSERGIK